MSGDFDAAGNHSDDAWGDAGFVDEVSQVGPSPWGELTPVSLTGGSEGFSELYFSTDFRENTIADLRLFVCTPLVWAAPPADLPLLPGVLRTE